MKKNFVLDTNILLDNPNNIFGFDDNNVWITGTTLQELDTKKRLGTGETKYNARESCRILDALRMKGSLQKGVDLDNGGKLFVCVGGIERGLLPAEYSLDVPDNKIICTCKSLKQTKEENFILVTNDISMRVNASMCGVTVQEYLNDIVHDSGYTGHEDIRDFPKIDELYRKGTLEYNGDDLYDMDCCLINGNGKPLENEYLTLHNGSASVLTVYREGYLTKVKEQTLFGWVRPMNAIQNYEMHSLMAPPEEIPLSILSGPAGTAKTFMSLAAGMEHTYVSQKHSDGIGMYRKILISRPNVETDEGFGYLPGDLQAKMNPLLAPYYDNLETLLRGKEKEESDDMIRTQIEDLMEDGVIEICPLNYIRGRSISNAFIICDEAQNAKRSLIRDIITRAGEGTKVVLLGDPAQIDAPTLDRRNNGLVYAIESMKGDLTTSILSNIPAKASVRSKLAQTAVQKMAPSYMR